MGQWQGETELAWALHRARQAEPRHALVESLDGRLRDERLHEEVLDRLAHARPASPPAGAATTPTGGPPVGSDGPTPAPAHRATGTPSGPATAALAPAPAIGHQAPGPPS